MTVNVRKAPFPWFGGKSKAAPLVWDLLGDPSHYVEAFAGSLAVLLNRPHTPNRPYHSETVNDADGLLCNAWRGIQLAPDATAAAASNPVAEADLHARHTALIRWREEEQLEHLMGDPLWCDPVMAGWWLWGVCSWIGGEWCDGRNGPWWPDEEGRLRKWVRGDPDRPGVKRQLPHLSNNGRGVNHAGTREPGVTRQRPHIADNGMGVNHAGTREPGVTRKRPHISDNGMGVNQPGTREPGVGDGNGPWWPGVTRQLPHLSDDGRGVNQPGSREPGVTRQRPHLSDDGMGVNRAGTREPGVEDGGEWHPVTMPELRRWFGWLTARLRHVRIVNGDWGRVCTTGAVQTIPVRQGTGHAGIFLDPPYGTAAGRASLYGATEDFEVADLVREWCIKWGDRPDYRIVLAGYDVEHGELEEHGWSVHEWFTAGYLTGGYGLQQGRERMWASPACRGGTNGAQLGLFDE